MNWFLIASSVIAFNVLLVSECSAKVSNSVKDLLKENSTVPIVLWHGMGDSCCNPLSMGRIKAMLEKYIPGVYVNSIMIGTNVIADTSEGFFGTINDQVADVCAMLSKDEKMTNGYHAIGFSQGSQFLRAVAQRCPQPPMLNLISFGGQHQGIFGLPKCPAESFICDKVRMLLDLGAYIGFVQNSLVQAQYWHDPYSEETYRQNSIFLADINNENKINEKYKANLLKLKHFVLVKFLNDTMVVPKESEWFEFYEEKDTSKIIPLEKSKIYTEDRIGLRTLHQSDRLHMIAFEGDHLDISESLFVSTIINKYLR